MNPLLKGKNFLLPLSAKTAITRAPQSKDPLNKTSTQTKAKPQNKPSEKSSEHLSAVALCEGGTQPAEKQNPHENKSKILLSINTH